MLQLFNFLLLFVANAVSSQSSACNRTGAKQSDFDQLCGSRFPNMTMRYLARTGFPSPSVFIVEKAMVGSAFPTTGRSRLYLLSVMTSQVSRC